MATTAFITGICGFAGSHLARHLLELGYEVHGLRLANETLAHLGDTAARVTLYTGDLTQAGSIRELIQAVRPSQVYHLAGLRTGSFAELQAVNVNGAFHLLEAVRLERGSNCPVVIVGSSAQYGLVPAENLPITEDAPFNPVNPYGVTKCAADVLGRLYTERYDVPVMRMRPFNYIGPGQQPGYVCPDLALQVLKAEQQGGGSITVHQPDARRDFVDVRDVARAFHLAAEKGCAGSAYNLCSNVGVSVREIAHLLSGMANKPVSVDEAQEEFAPGNIPFQVGSYARLEADTGWRPEILLEQSLMDLLNELRHRQIIISDGKNQTL